MFAAAVYEPGLGTRGVSTLFPISKNLAEVRECGTVRRWLTLGIGN